jgi:hypothetical protein
MALGAIVLWCGAAGQAGAQALASPPASGPDDIARLLHREAFLPGAGPVRWETGRMEFARPGGAVDALQVNVGGTVSGPAGLALRDASAFQPKGYEVTLSRDFPALSFGNDEIDLDVSPHAGVGMTSFGGSAEAGARMELSRKSGGDKADDKLKAMGVRDGAAFGDRGRWYLFAAASGRAVGLNMLRGEGGWDRAGWTTDPQSTLISDAQVGVGWRKNHVQTSLGLVHREVKGKHMIMGQDTKDDTLLAFSLSIKPRR